jgi:hypothetical protein
VASEIELLPPAVPFTVRLLPMLPTMSVEPELPSVTVAKPEK